MIFQHPFLCSAKRIHYAAITQTRISKIPGLLCILDLRKAGKFFPDIIRHVNRRLFIQRTCHLIRSLLVHLLESLISILQVRCRLQFFHIHFRRQTAQIIARLRRPAKNSFMKLFSRLQHGHRNHLIAAVIIAAHRSNRRRSVRHFIFIPIFFRRFVQINLQEHGIFIGYLIQRSDSVHHYAHPFFIIISDRSIERRLYLCFHYTKK